MYRLSPHVSVLVAPLRVVVVMVVLFLTLIPGCSSDDTEMVDPTQTLADSAEAMKGLQSFHFVYEVTKPDDAPRPEGLEIVRIVGDVVADGNMQATIDLTQSGVPLQIEFVAAGDTHYVQNPTNQEWQSMPAAFSPVGKLNLSTGAIQILERIQDPAYVGTEDIGGTRTHHIQGEVAAAEVATIAGSTTTDEPFTGDVWIGVDDGLVRRIVVLGAATSSEPEGTLRTIDLSAFDEPLEIVPPQ
jgi:hypothetical protein